MPRGLARKKRKLEFGKYFPHELVLPDSTDILMNALGAREGIWWESFEAVAL